MGGARAGRKSPPSKLENETKTSGGPDRAHGNAVRPFLHAITGHARPRQQNEAGLKPFIARAFGLVAALSVLSLLAGPAGAADTVRYDDFSKAEICPCDCVFQYKVALVTETRESLLCEAQYDDGEWAAITQNKYSPSDQLIFFSPEDIAGFRCQTIATQ